MSDVGPLVRVSGTVDAGLLPGSLLVHGPGVTYRLTGALCRELHPGDVVELVGREVRSADVFMQGVGLHLESVISAHGP